MLMILLEGCGLQPETVSWSFNSIASHWKGTNEVRTRQKSAWRSSVGNDFTALDFLRVVSGEPGQEVTFSVPHRLHLQKELLLLPTYLGANAHNTE